MTNLTCSHCGASLTCRADDINACWCNELPAILPINNATSCLCRECTIKQINIFLSKLYEQPLAEQIAFAKPFYQHGNLIENLDYTLENNYMVFSRWFFLKRGKCCTNGCTHCPFND